MVKAVKVTKYEAADGSRHDTRAAAQLRDWTNTPGEVVLPAKVKHAGITYDLHGNLWRWSCGRCKKEARQLLDTMLRYYSAGCEHCLATNVFDFNKYDGVDEKEEVAKAATQE